MAVRILALWVAWTAVLVLGGWFALRAGWISPVHGVLLHPAPAPSRVRELGYLALLALVLYLPPLAITARWLWR